MLRKRNNPVHEMEEVDDIAQLETFENSVLLECVERRFWKEKVYTYVGDTVIAVNPCHKLDIYSKKEHELYTNIRIRSSQPAHIFWAADVAHRALQEGTGQCIVVTGDSGAGKTENTKFLLNHLVHLDGKSTEQRDLITKLEKINLVIEFFGNAETSLNENSSRFGKLIEISYADDNTIDFAKIEAYVLEKFRVTQPNGKEKNFHAFHALFAGMSEEELQTLELEDSCDYRILTALDMEDQRKYEKMYIQMVKLFKEIGIDEKTTDQINRILSAILHLTQIEFDEDPDGAAGIANEISGEHLQSFFRMLNFDPQDSEDFIRYFTENEVRGESRKKTITEAEDGRDSLARELYSSLFYGIIDITNSLLCKTHEDRRKKTIRILDVSGFENIPLQNSLEQLLINTVNENLQQFFLRKAFKDELEEFSREDIKFEEINFQDNAATLDLLYESPRSIFSILNDSVTIQSATSATFLENLKKEHPDVVPPCSWRDGHLLFKIEHFADTVWYNASDFIEKNRDTISTSIRNIILGCNNVFAQKYFLLGSLATTSRNRGGRMSFRGDRRLSDSLNLSRSNKLVGRVTDDFRVSMKRMMEKIQTLQPIFVRCVKPNHKLLRGKFERNLVHQQLQNSGIMDVARVRNNGYPIRITFVDFYERYKLLLDEFHMRSRREATEKILEVVQSFDYQVGKTKIFLKMAVRDILEAKLMEKEESIKRVKEEELRIKQQNMAEKQSEADSLLSSQTQLRKQSSVSDGADSGTSSLKQSPSASMVTSDFQIAEENISQEEESVIDNNTKEETCKEEKEEKKKKKRQKNTKHKKEAWETMCISERDCENSKEFETMVKRGIRLFMYLVLLVMVCGCCTISRISLMWITNNIPLNKNTDKAGDIAFIQITGCFTFPMVLKWLSCLVRTLFGTKQFPSIKAIIVLTCVDTLQTSSSCCFMILIMPYLMPIDITIISLLVCQLPSVFNIFNIFSARYMPLYEFPDTLPKDKKPKQKKPLFIFTVFLSMLTFIVQVGSLIVLLFYGNLSKLPYKGDYSKLRIGSLAAMTCIFTSIGWWENFAFGKVPLCKIDLSEFRKNLRQVRLTSYIYSGPVQILTSGLMSHYLLGSNFSESWDLFVDSFSQMFHHKEKIVEHFKLFGLMYIQLVSTYLSAYCSGLACRLHMQRFGFALPILVVPIFATVLTSVCHPILIWWKLPDTCFKQPMPSGQEMWITIGIGIAVYFSYLFTSRHIWFPKIERMAKLERIFSFGYSNPVFPDISLALKRRQDEAENEEYKKKVKTVKTPMVYICATMWHEIKQEMIQLCKSLFRIDFDICQRYLANKSFGAHIDDLYTAEIHIIFDDAFQTDEKTKQRVVNSYVEQLIDVMPEACSSVSKGNVTLDPVKKITTPYGGRLEWIMPGGTKMEVHLKDKNKIRHKKRWSQIMYMYYLLGHKLLKDYSSSDELLREYKTSKKTAVRPHSSMLNRLPHSVVEEAANTFVMALDGDVDFGPEAVRLLIDRMKKNRDVAAVCGRIHPIGNGPMVWYQQFEYSVGHWLQKATENVLGCVLCCPGCFSLFRGLSLMDDNVMRLYAIEPTEAKHYIQYEQGEDRWLCTLLLQQGYKIDYCAGSDAFTYAPETFNDFYIQRRRWSPSTMANVMDLLGSWKNTIKMNNNISTLFMLYQFVLMTSSILAPGTVAFMISGSYKSVLGLNPWQSYLLSNLPVLAYILLCLKAKTQIQVGVAAVLSAIYSIVMVIVSIGTVINIVEEDFLTPNVLFLIGLSAIYVITALAHPKELTCLFHGILYYLTVPSTFVFLTVFFLCNLNVVSWGTREAPKKVDPDEEVGGSQAPPKKGKLTKFVESLGISNVLDDLRTFLRQMLGNKQPSETPSREPESGLSTPLPGQTLPKPKAKVIQRKPKEKVVIIDPDHWKKSDCFEDGTEGQLDEKERIFWEKLITKFLLPIKENKEKQDQIAADLISIRNNVVFAYFLLNLMFTLVILQLELKQEILRDKFFLFGKYEPMSAIFLAVFSILILTQFISMLVHRWGTFLLLIASTDIPLLASGSKDNTNVALKQIEEMQKGERDLEYNNGSDIEYPEYKAEDDLIDSDEDNTIEMLDTDDSRSKYEKIVEKEHRRRQSIIAISDKESLMQQNSWVAQTRRDHTTMAVRDLYRQSNRTNYQNDDFYQDRNHFPMQQRPPYHRRYQSRYNMRRTRRESIFNDIPECDYD